jgi:hypothetical protein
MTKEKLVVYTALTLGFVLIVNGTWQLVAPEAWYWAIPGVPDRGPFNQHFVRDIGIIYALSGAGLIMGGLRAEHRTPYWWAPTLWLCGHALFHFWEVAVGICGPESLLEDFAGVTLPALITLALMMHARNDNALQKSS